MASTIEDAPTAAGGVPHDSGGRRLVGRGVEDEKPTLADVVAAYRLFLAREPESLEAIEQQLNVPTIGALRRRFSLSAEFRAKLRPLVLQDIWVASELPSGLRLWLNLADSYVSQDALLGGWESSETRYMTSRLRPGQGVLDIGANIGWFTLIAAQAVGAEGHVHAFEPNSEVLPYLARSLRENGLDTRVTVHALALWDEPGERFVGRLSSDFNLGHAWLLEPGEERQGGVVADRSTTVRLDDLSGIGAIDFIKIDIEGAEPKALRGAERLIAAHRPVILSELYPEQMMRVSGTTAEAFIARMAGLGYGCWLLEDGAPTQALDAFPQIGRDLVSVAFEPIPVKPRRRRTAAAKAR